MSGNCDDCGGSGAVCPACGVAQNALSVPCWVCGAADSVACGSCGPQAAPEAALGDEVIVELMGTAAGRRELSRVSPVFFDTYYCGMTWAPFREKWLTRYDTMIRQCRATGRKGRALTIAPRSHGKTEAFISLLTREICLDRNIRTIWVGKTATVAQKRVRRVKSLLLSPRIQADWCTAPELGFGPFLTGKDGRAPGTPSEKWNDNMIVTARQRQSVDATLEAVGVGGAVTGGHFDLALLDDLEDDENVRIASRREALREWLGGTFSPMMDPGSSSLFVGTRKHHDDCYSHMKRDPTYEVIEERAVVKWPEAFEYEYGRDDDGRKIVTGVKAEGAYEVLWPGGRPLSFLLMERLSIGSRLFEREYQGVVQDDSAAPVKWSHLEAAMDAGSFLSFYDVPDVRGLVVVQGWDFALVHDAAQAEASDSDYTVGVTWGKDLDGNRYLLSAVRFRGVAPSRLRQIVQAEFNRWCKLGVRPRFVAVERNNFGELHYLGLRKQTDLPVRPHHTSGKRKADPWDGVPSLAMLFENDKVVLPTGDEDSAKVSRTLCAELWGLGREAHDDMPMALWIAETVLRDLKPTRRFIIGDVEISEQEAILAEQAAAQAEKPPPGKVNRDREREIQASQLWGDLGGIVDGGREVADRLEFESKAGGFSYNG